MHDEDAAELSARIDVAEAFLHALGRNLQGKILEKDEWEQILESFEALAPVSDPSHDFYKKLILDWFDSGRADLSESADKLLTHGELRQRLFKRSGE